MDERRESKRWMRRGEGNDDIVCVTSGWNLPWGVGPKAEESNEDGERFTGYRRE